MSDSTADPETPGDPGEAPEATEKSEPQRGFFEEIEHGIGHLFAAFEKGVIDIADAEGRKRRGEDAQTLDAEGATSVASVPPEEPPAPRRNTSYDEVLQPIRWRSVWWSFVGLLVLIAAYVGANFLQVWTSADDDETQPADAIVVLGAAQFDGTPSPTLAARLDHAVDLWRDDVAPIVITTGANQEGDRFTEGFSGYVYLLEAGIPDDALLNIIDGVDTYQQLSATEAQVSERGFDSVVVVSDGFHSRRVRAIADEVGLDVFVSPTEVGATFEDYARETAAMSVGRIMGFRRLSNFVSGS